MPGALITGLSGQDGTLLARRLLAEGWSVEGTVRSRLDFADERVALHQIEFSDTAAVARLISETSPDVVFNLAGLSSVAASWEDPVASATVNGVAAVALMESAWSSTTRGNSKIRFVQASSAEIFGDVHESPQTERTPIAPSSPYGTAKALAHVTAQMYRRRGMFVSNAILYNHESSLRPDTFVTRKISKAVAEISLGLRDALSLGNLDVRRDWGWAPDYVDAMFLMATSESADDFIIATGEAHSVREFVDVAFRAAGVTEWHGLVKVDTSLVRPADAEEKLGDYSRIRDRLGWRPTVTFAQMVESMVEHDLRLLRAETR